MGRYGSISENLIQYQTLSPIQCRMIFDKTSSTAIQMLLVDYQDIDMELIKEIIDFGISESDYDAIDYILCTRKIDSALVDDILYNNAWYWNSDGIFNQELNVNDIGYIIEYIKDVVKAELGITKEYFVATPYPGDIEFSSGEKVLRFISENYATEEQKNDIYEFLKNVNE